MRYICVVGFEHELPQMEDTHPLCLVSCSEYSLCQWSSGSVLQLGSLFFALSLLSSEMQDTSFFLFSMFSIQFELCGVLPGERAEDTALALMFLPEVISSP